MSDISLSVATNDHENRPPQPAMPLPFGSFFPPSKPIERRYTKDSRVYPILLPDGTEVYYPGVTTILGDVHVGYEFDQWKSEQVAKLGIEGARLDMFLRAERGTAVHHAIERYLKGQTLCWHDPEGRELFSDFEWRCLSRFVDFIATLRPEVLATEMAVYSHTYRYAGTLDAILRIDGELVVVDWKTSGQVNRNHDLQVAAYAEAAKEMFPGMFGRIPGAAVLALSTSHKTSKRNPDGSANGPGWHFKPVKDHVSAYTSFRKRLDVFEDEHGIIEPKRDLLDEVLTPSHRISGGLEG